MKKLTKMDIDALRETLPVLSREEQQMYTGMYSGDCFWKCVSYLNTGNAGSSDSLALAYWEDRLGSIDAAYDQVGYTAFVNNGEARAYLSSNGGTPNTYGDHIAYVDVSKIGSYNYDDRLDSNFHGIGVSSTFHYVVMLDFSGDTWSAYDPDRNKYFTISSGEYDGSGVRFIG